MSRGLGGLSRLGAGALTTLTRTRALWMAAGGLSALALLLYLVPTSVATADLPPAEGTLVQASGSRTADPESALAFDAIVERNIFSPDRAPPASRYVPPGGAAPAQAAPATTGPAPVRLFGIAVGPDGAVALIDADPEIPGAEIYRLGDMVRGARVSAITDTTVVLDGPSGRTVLRLPDSN